MIERNKTWFYLILLLSVLWILISVRWYTCGIKGFCEGVSTQDRVDKSAYIERSEDRVPDDIEFRPTETITEGGRRTVRTETQEVERIIECPTYLNGFMKAGVGATASEVRKLESFLNDYEGEDLDINGLYQSDDIAAVNRFQVKYEKDVLAPFGLKTPTGNVFASTRNHINALHCAYNLDTSL